jgi:ribosomal protein S18 acetylase RimI-like enzyme
METPVRQVVVRDLRVDETAAAAGVLGHGMRDNPLHQCVFGADAARRESALRRLFTELLAQCHPKGAILGAFAGDDLVGVCAMVRPGRCQAGLREKLGLAALRWTSAWTRHDPQEPHWHLGPVGVRRDLQGHGVGTALLRTFVERMDARRDLAYLETDKQANVPFYERFGFEVVARAPVLGIPNWFMARTAAVSIHPPRT